MTRAIWISVLRLVRSASLPQIGVEIVEVSRVAVTTHVKDDCPPSRSVMIFGRDEDTTDIARTETNMPSRIPDSARSTSLCVMAGGSPWRWSGSTTTDWVLGLVMHTPARSGAISGAWCPH